MNFKFYLHFYAVSVFRIMHITVALLCFNYVSNAQTGYIYLHKKTLDEINSPNFEFTITGGPTTVTPVVLNDSPSSYKLVSSLGGDAAGGLWALAADNADASGNFRVFYRAPGTGSWLQVPGQALDIDGGAGGNYISADAAGQVYYYDGTTLSNVTSNLPSPAIEVSDNWTGIQYALLDNYQVWKRTLPSLTWEQVPGVQAYAIDAFPGTNELAYIRWDRWDVYRIQNDGTGEVYLDQPDGNLDEIAVTENGEIYTADIVSTFHFNGTSWQSEPGGAQMGIIGGGVAGQLWGAIVLTGDATLRRIISRTESGEYLADENIRLSAADNSVLIPVVPGTYTVTESSVGGWHLNKITLYEAQSPSTVNVSSRTATIQVSDGEVVHVEFENQFTQETTIVNNCDEGFTFTETFGSGIGYGPALTGLTSYHYANSNFGYGYYAVIDNTDKMAALTGNFSDHTGNSNGRMLAVDATIERGVFYKRRFNGLIPGGNYSFSAWIMNVNAHTGPGGATDVPNVSFNVYDGANGDLIATGNSGDVTEVGVWKQVSFAFTATSDILDLELMNNTLGTNGNDLAIDDISFGVAIPDPVTISSDVICNGGGSITIESHVGSGYEYSIDGTNYQSTPVFTGLVAGDYNVSVRYTSGSCTSNSIPVSISGTVCPPLAVDDEKLNNPGGTPVTVEILDNDEIFGGGQADTGNTTVTLTTTGLPAGSNVSGNTLTVPGEGEYLYNPATGGLTFTPEPTFSGNPTPITYVLTENDTNLSSEAIVKITYNALPVKLISFDASVVESHVLLSWSTTEEMNSDFFQIEKSLSGTDWYTVGRQKSYGESRSIKEYHFTDTRPYGNLSYYRLKIVDLDQTFTYSPIRAVNGKSSQSPSMIVFPNPAKRRLTISVCEITSVEKVVLVNTSGIIVHQQSDLTTEVLHLPALPEGLYVIRVHFKNGSYVTSKVVISESDTK